MKADTDSERAINALAETFSYTELSDDDIRSKDFQSMNQAYAWAVAKSTIAFPFLTLEKAKENVKSNLEPIPSWGVVKNKVMYLPAPNEDRTVWAILVYLYESLKPDDVHVEYLTKEDDTVPDLSNDIIVRNGGVLNVVFRRLLELAKNPYSATIRTGTSLSNEDVYRNAIDFVFLDKIYRLGSKNWSKLEISDKALEYGRRVERIENKQGKRTFFSNVFLGYRLSDYLNKTVNDNDNKVKESTPICRFIYELIDAILARKPIPRDYDLPKTFFRSPNSSIRTGIRKGPAIKTKNGTKVNLYAPFTFVKSTECEGMPDHIKKTATDLSSKVVNQIDQINKLSCKEANDNIDSYKDYLYLSYVLSDFARKSWRKDLQCPDYFEIEEILDSCITSASKVRAITFDADKIKGLIRDPPKVTMISPITSAEDQASCRKAIEDAAERRRKSGRNS
jgi:hypothetical protein